MNDWQPIETAPKGVAVLVWDGRHQSIAELSDYQDWYALVQGEYQWEGDSSTGGLARVDEVINWAPLPAPPSA